MAPNIETFLKTFEFLVNVYAPCVEPYIWSFPSHRDLPTLFCFSSNQTRRISCSKLECQPCCASLYFGKSLEFLRQWRSTLHSSFLPIQFNRSLRVTGVISLKSYCEILIRVSLLRFGIVERTQKVIRYVFFSLTLSRIFLEIVEWNWVGGPNGKYLGQGHGVQAEWSASVTEILW